MIRNEPSSDAHAVTTHLARSVAATEWTDIPPDVVHQAKRSFMNFFAVALAGSHTSPVELALKSLAQFSGGQQASIVGRRERIDVLSAVFLNAAAANVHDFCDTHVKTVIHPTAPVVPPVLALAELKTTRGRDLLLAFIVGQEVQARIGLAISPDHYNRGWHITSTCGGFGAASAAGKLLGLDESQLISALGIAATQSAGLCECLGTPAKSISVGNAARNGLWSALLAEQGYQGPAEPLAGKQGFYNALAGPVNLSFAMHDFGRTWELMATSYKPYPCGFVIHPVLDCVLDWRKSHPEEIVTSIVVRGNPLMKLRADRPGIQTGREAQVSVQHAVAAALITGRAGIPQFEDNCVMDERVRALRERVVLLSDDNIATVAASVQITAANGKVYELVQTAARGSDANPLSDTDLEEKLRVSASEWNPAFDPDPLIAAIWSLDRSADVSGLAAMAT
jgi:2-methylcitrate dehydratase PrpD